ncbi:MAG TPA: 30S ribosomal protein S2 [Candidatus Pacearchaeota archaeon]|nr:30S ribosomal protein S2 [Candidatus Pacearchaeota archaeon]HOK94439.1 30S ribosomal protein S2 [Candidatus Pacearchaeota archaeon]HPO75507.1 30S ribosomal protein S2 [Candidatus Pacearchaeota archaeon]
MAEEKSIKKTENEAEKKIEKIEKIEKIKKEDNLPKDKEIQEMFEAGLHFGHHHSKMHPKMKPFIYGKRNGIDIIDFLKTKEYLEKALDFLKSAKEKNSLILFVGTKISAKNLIKELAEELKMPYVIERWLGGTLTNFETISKRIEYLKEIEAKKEKGELEKYKKKERIKINQKIEKMERKLGGLKNLTRLPDLLFVVDVAEEHLAVKEANMKGIPIVGICDTNGDPTSVNYPILANDDAISSLKYILNKVKEALKTKNQ